MYAHSYLTQLRYPKMDVSTMHIVGYSNAAFANNDDLSSQLWRVIFLVDGDENAEPIAFKSYKLRRATRSVLAAEVIAFANMFDESFAIKDTIEVAIANSVQLHLLTDSKSFFDTISKGNRTNEKRLMLDVYVARQGYKEQDIGNIGFLRSNNNIADELTKSMNQEVLRNVNASEKLRIDVEHWIIRKPKDAREERH